MPRTACNAAATRSICPTAMDPLISVADSCTQPAALQLASAMALATQEHLHQPRKVSGSAYLSHPMLAAGMVMKAGGTVRAAQIALLHDVVEEGGEGALARLRASFSSSICTAVALMTPPAQDAKLPWEQRKEQSIARMQAVHDRDVAMAFAADKAATLLELELDCQHFGTAKVMGKLRGGPEQLLWYYQACWHALFDKINDPMCSLLKTHVEWLRQRALAWP
jgi:guanosine-3',5'-bis(diphosphate) 3'-pyrophosphohydrolase